MDYRCSDPLMTISALRFETYLKFLQMEPLFGVVLGGEVCNEVKGSETSLTTTRDEHEYRLGRGVGADGCNITIKLYLHTVKSGTAAPFTFFVQYSRTPLLRPPSKSHWGGRKSGVVVHEGFDLTLHNMF